jgi:FkbM family methyltransferase
VRDDQDLASEAAGADLPPVDPLVQAILRGEVTTSPDLQIVRAMIYRQQVLFSVNFARDPVQRVHRAGRFYEEKELQTLRNFFPIGGVFVDIGANVGNHSLFVARFLNPSLVIPFEPNPAAYSLLINNVLINDLLDRFDLSKLGVGVSDVRSGGFAVEQRRENLGAARMLPDSGDVSVWRGDMVLGDVAPDFIKIDVEGMEMKVLRGLSGVLAQRRPAMLVEVDNANADEFAAWVKDNSYAVKRTFVRYPSNKNHLIVLARPTAGTVPE